MLIAGLLILAVSYFSVVAKIFGWIVAWMVKAMNFIVFTIEGIPFSKIDNIVITPMQSLIMVIMIICLLLLFEQRKFYYTMLLTTGIVFFPWSSWRNDQSTLRAAPGSLSCIKTFCPGRDVGSKALSLCDSSLATNVSLLDFHLKPGRMQYGVENM